MHRMRQQHGGTFLDVLKTFFIIFGYAVPRSAGSEPIKALLKTSLKLS